MSDRVDPSSGVSPSYFRSFVNVSCHLTKRVASVAYSVFYYMTTPARDFFQGVVSWWWKEEGPRTSGTEPTTSESSSAPSTSSSSQDETSNLPCTPPPETESLRNKSLEWLFRRQEALFSPTSPSANTSPFTKAAEGLGKERELDRIALEIERRKNLLDHSIPLPNPTEEFYDLIEQDEKEFNQFDPNASELITSLAPSETPTSSDFTIDTPGSEFFSCASSEEQELPLLELWKESLPGRHITCTLSRTSGLIEINLTDYLLENILRINEVKDFTLDEEQNFTLTYAEPLSLSISKLPQKTWDKLWAISSVAYCGVSGILKTSPTAQIASCLRGRILVSSLGTKIEFDSDAFSYKGSAYLKSITVMNDPSQNKGKSLFIEAEHNLPFLAGETSGPADHQLFITILDMNLYPEEYS